MRTGRSTSSITWRPTARQSGWLSDSQQRVLRWAAETAGLATVADDGTLTLRLRMPDCLANQYGKHLTIEGVRFAYGHEQVLAALGSKPNTPPTDASTARRRLGPHWVRRSATGSSGTARAGGCSLPPT